MNGMQILLVVVATVFAVFLGLGFVLPFLARKGIYMPGVISSSKSVLDTVQSVMEGLQGMFPDKRGLEIADKIILYAQQAVEAAEQLYITSEIEADQRKDAATKLVYDLLNTAGVIVDDNIKKVVDGCIEAAVHTMKKVNADAMVLEQTINIPALPEAQNTEAE